MEKYYDDCKHVKHNTVTVTVTVTVRVTVTGNLNTMMTVNMSNIPASKVDHSKQENKPPP